MLGEIINIYTSINNPETRNHLARIPLKTPKIVGKCVGINRILFYTVEFKIYSIGNVRHTRWVQAMAEQALQGVHISVYCG